MGVYPCEAMPTMVICCDLGFGAIGELSLHVVEDQCVVNVHVAAFFDNFELGLRTARFDADAVPVGIPVGDYK